MSSHISLSDGESSPPVRETAQSDHYPPPQEARRILIRLLFPSMLMPMVSTMSRVALPIIRDDFQIQADMTAWVASPRCSFTTGQVFDVTGGRATY